MGGDGDGGSGRSQDWQSGTQSYADPQWVWVPQWKCEFDMQTPGRDLNDQSGHNFLGE